MKTKLQTFLVLHLGLAAVLAQPAITTQPQSQTVRLGSTAFFAVTAAGTPPLTYQWRQDGVDIPGATGPTCSLGLARRDQAGSYTVVVSDSTGSVTSSPPAMLTVNLIPAGAVIVRRDNFFGQAEVPEAAGSGVVSIAVGFGHTLALKEDGSVVAWGDNTYGQTDVPEAARNGVKAIAAGLIHSVALMSDGSVVEWGEAIGPIPMEAQSGVTAVAAGAYHTVALKIDGSVIAWGSDSWGETTVPAEAQSGIVAIAAGAGHTVDLKHDGSVVAWGDDRYGQATVPPEAQSGVTAIAAQNYSTLVLKDDGSVLTWRKQSETGSVYTRRLAPSGVRAITAGGNSYCFRTDEGWQCDWDADVTTVALGYDRDAAIVIPAVPIITSSPAGQTVNFWQNAILTVLAKGYPWVAYQWRKDGVDIAGATNASYILRNAQTNDAGNYTVVVSNSLGLVTSMPAAVLVIGPASPGSVVAWGAGINNGDYPNFGQSLVPVEAQGGVSAVAAGSFHTVALMSDGGVVAWDVDGGPLHPPTAARSGIVAIAAGSGHTVALKRDGSVIAWGYDNWGETKVPAAASSGVTGIAAGGLFTAALRNDGSVVAWGNNDCGQTNVPTDLSNVVAIAVGWAHMVVLRADGSVLAWGCNNSGQTDVPFEAQSGVSAIAAGLFHTVALKNDGSVVAWGRNDYGQTLVPSAARSGVIAIAAGKHHSVALKQDRSIVAWGGGATNTRTEPHYGQSLVPPGLAGVTAIAAGEYHTVALIGGVPLKPCLQVQRTTNALICSWSTNAVGFTLQSTVDLTPPAIWDDAAISTVVVGGRFTVSNSLSSPARFYRLKKP